MSKKTSEMKNMMRYFSLFVVGLGLVAILSSCETRKARKLEDIGFGEYFGRYAQIASETKAVTNRTCSTNLVPTLDAGADRAKPGNLGFILAIGNRTNVKTPIVLPECSLSGEFPMLTFYRDGKKLAYFGPCASLEGAEQRVVSIPAGMEYLFFYAGIPMHHELTREIPAGHYRVEWPFHDEAFVEFDVKQDGKVVFSREH